MELKMEIFLVSGTEFMRLFIRECTAYFQVWMGQQRQPASSSSSSSNDNRRESHSREEQFEHGWHGGVECEGRIAQLVFISCMHV